MLLYRSVACFGRVLLSLKTQIVWERVWLVVVWAGCSLGESGVAGSVRAAGAGAASAALGCLSLGDAAGVGLVAAAADAARVLLADAALHRSAPPRRALVPAAAHRLRQSRVAALVPHSSSGTAGRPDRLMEKKKKRMTSLKIGTSGIQLFRQILQHPTILLRVRRVSNAQIFLRKIFGTAATDKHSKQQNKKRL